MNKIKGVVYDLDGTIIMTQALHEDAWVFATQKFDISITKDMLLNQRGLSNKASASMILPSDKKHLSDALIAAKVAYVNEHTDQITLFPDIEKIIDQLFDKGHKVWIFTSARKDFVEKIRNNFSVLKKVNTVWREMYDSEKPAPDGLYLTMKKMNLQNSEVCYIGDALSDYGTSCNAEVKFIYFCPNIENRDSRIPKAVSTISFHRDVFELLPDL